MERQNQKGGLRVEIGKMQFGEILNHMTQANPSWAGGAAGAMTGAMAMALVLKINGLVGKASNENSLHLLLALAEKESGIYPRILESRQHPEEHKRQILAALNLSRDIAYLCLQEAQTQLARLPDVKATWRPDLITCVHLFYAGAASALTNIRANLTKTTIDFPVEELEHDLHAVSATLATFDH
jgi:formiminotetrahydrofolate cyclodeaminase